MKTIKTLQLFLTLILALSCLVACDKDDESLASINEVTLEGDASTFEINMKRTNWYIEAVEPVDGPLYGDTPRKLEGLGTLYFNWGSIVRDREDALTVHTNDNYSKEDRGIIISLKMREGFYTETITIRQKQCTNYYRIESIAYTLEEGDGIKEAPGRRWGQTYIDKRGKEEVVTEQLDFHLLYGEAVNYSFHSKEFDESCIDPNNETSLVDMPEGIEDGRIVFEKDKRKYTETSLYRNEEMGEPYTVDMVTWKRNYYSATIYCKCLQASYTLTLSRPGNDGVKVVKGKLTKEYPYAHSPISHQVSDLEPED